MIPCFCHWALKVESNLASTSKSTLLALCINRPTPGGDDQKSCPFAPRAMDAIWFPSPLSRIWSVTSPPGPENLQIVSSDVERKSSERSMLSDGGAICPAVLKFDFA